MGMAQDQRNASDNRWVADSKKQWIGYHGVANVRHPHAQPNMQAIHDFHERTTRHDYVEWTAQTPSEFKWLWHNATGFRETRTYAKFGDPSQWNASTWLYTKSHRDCRPRHPKAPVTTDVVFQNLPPGLDFSFLSPPKTVLPPGLDFSLMGPPRKKVGRGK
jgi:hypothetical protein